MVEDHVRISPLWESFLHFHTSKSQQMPCRHDGTIYHGNFPRHFGFLPFLIKYLTNKNRIKILQKYLRNGSFKIIRLKTTGQEKIFLCIRNYYYSLTF